jgi:hypothetical protein
VLHIPRIDFVLAQDKVLQVGNLAHVADEGLDDTVREVVLGEVEDLDVCEVAPQVLQDCVGELVTDQF